MKIEIVLYDRCSQESKPESNQIPSVPKTITIKINFETPWENISYGNNFQVVFINSNSGNTIKLFALHCYTNQSTAVLMSQISGVLKIFSSKNRRPMT